VLDTDDAETLAQRVLEVEHKLYPEVITLFAQGRITIINGKVKTITNE
jgi:phosphoribosylglycinamide formyltransferase-1